jgi:chromosome segregation ATPase
LRLDDEWEVDCDLERAKAAIVSLSKQRDDAYLDLREAREAHKAERDELEKHLSEAEDDRDAAKAKLDRLRKALHCISLDEYESTSSASEKVHGHARIARTALSETKDAWEYRCRGCQAKLADVFVNGTALPRVTLCDTCSEAKLPAMWREDIQSLNECLERVSKEIEETKKDRDEAERRGERLLRDRDLVDAKLAEANESLKTLTACNESLRGLFQKLRDAVNMPVEAEAEVTDRILRELERLKPTALDRRE